MLILSDLHLDCFKQWSTIKEGYNTRLLDQLNAVDYIGKLIELEKIENVIFLGDMIHSYAESWHKAVTNAVAHTINTLSKRARLYILVGNHDIYRDKDIFEPYRDRENVHIVSTTAKALIEGHTIDLVPWGGSLPSDVGEVLMAHMEVAGAKMNAAGIKSPTGYLTKELEGYKYIFLGHFHEFQELRVRSATYAAYIGSVMQIDLGLSPNHKGVTRFVDGRVIFELVPSPKIRTMQIDYEYEVPLLEKAVEKGDYWRVTVTDMAIQLPSFDHRVQIEYDVKPKVEERLEHIESENLKDTTKRFIDQVDTRVNKELAKKLLDEVM